MTGESVAGPSRYRNLAAMHESRRCGARSRSGAPCRGPAVRGRRRCRMHGGAKGSGAQKGNRNALRHGFYSRVAIRRRRDVAALIRQAKGASGEW